MKNFPPEFADILSPKGKRILNGNEPEVARDFRAANPHYISMRGVIENSKANACRELLDRLHFAELKEMKRVIPRDSIWGMKKNYSEQLAKNMRNRTSYLTSRKELALGLESGVLPMMRSESFRLFAERMTGCKLKEDWGSQIICYGHGDYSGPHNDHHPEYEHVRNGYVDFHVMLANNAVSHQWLVSETRGLLNNIQSINLNGAASAYLLPFWHYTTPLVAKPGLEAKARRWLLLGSFEIASRWKQSTGRPDVKA